MKLKGSSVAEAILNLDNWRTKSPNRASVRWYILEHEGEFLAFRNLRHRLVRAAMDEGRLYVSYR